MKRILSVMGWLSWFVASALIIGSWPSRSAAQTISVDRSLLQTLREKGVLTEEEYGKLTKQAEQEEKATAWAGKVEAGYKNGVYVKTTDDRFLLRLNANVQGSFQYRDATDIDETTFRVRRARLYFTGHAFYPWLKFYNQLTLEGNVSNILLRDFFLQATYFKAAQPRLGQSKVPFDREFLVSAFNLQLVERSIVSDEFLLDRDIGLQLLGSVADGLLTYAVGVFNGSGANRANVDRSMMGVARVVLAPLGPFPTNLESTSWYAQSALDRPSTPRLAIGLAAAGLPDLEPGERSTLAGRLGSASVVPVKSDVVQVTGDLAFQWHGFSLEAAGHWRRINPLAPLSGKSLPQTDAQGYFVQAGYFLSDLLPAVPKGLELAARYAWVNPDNPVNLGRNSQEAVTAGVNYFLSGHRLKAQVDYEYRDIEAQTKPTVIDHRVRAQITFQF